MISVVQVRGAGDLDKRNREKRSCSGYVSMIASIGFPQLLV